MAMTLEQVLDSIRAMHFSSDSVFATWADAIDAHLSQPAQAVDVERVLAALGHVRVPNARCLARVAETPNELAPPGPRNPPMWCCLPEGHDGQHRHNGGGMYPSIPFRDTDEVVMVPLPDYCEKCNRIWPCDDAKALTRAIGTAQEGWRDGEWSRMEARLAERKTVHEWLNDLSVEHEEFGKPICLLRRLRILCDRYRDICDQLTFEIKKQAGWISTDVSRPERNTLAIYWHKSEHGGFPAIADEWRDEHHLAYASHWLPYRSPTPPTDGEG